MTRRRSFTAWGALIITLGGLLGFASFIAWALPGCSATAQAKVAHSTTVALNAITDVVDPAYEATMMACDQAEGIAIQHGKLQRFASIRAACNKVFASFEDVRLAQLAARDIVAQVEAGKVDVAAMIDAVAKVKAAVDVQKQAWSKAKPMIEGSAQ